MLAVQQYLRDGRALRDITSELGINVYEHPSLPLVGLKYSQIESPKTHPVVRDCRGIVLERDTWNVVAKPFRRFFNAGEDQESFRHFDWADFTCTAKEDGSLVILYHYRGEWHANTSGSFGLGICGFSGKTWRQLFWEASNVDPALLDTSLTYIWELCTHYNKVIRIYPSPVAYLLAAFDVATCRELLASEVDAIASELRAVRPQHYRFSSMDDITEFLREMESRDKTFEGVVIRGRRIDNPKHEDRYKIKTQTYVALHQLLDNGNLFNPKRLVPLVLAGEADEALAYIPELKPHLDLVQAQMEQAFAELRSIWQQTWEIPSQKDFALSIVGKTRFASILFGLRKDKGGNQCEVDLRKAWRESGDIIVKVLYSS